MARQERSTRRQSSRKDKRNESVSFLVLLNLTARLLRLPNAVV